MGLVHSFIQQICKWTEIGIDSLYIQSGKSFHLNVHIFIDINSCILKWSICLFRQPTARIWILRVLQSRTEVLYGPH